MADLNSLVQKVFTITNRPDLQAETELAVKSAILQAHRLDYFPKDLREETLKFTTAEYLQAIEYKTLFPRFKSLKYIRKYDNSTTPPSNNLWYENGMGSFLKMLTPEQVLDRYSFQLADVCYLAGSLLQIKSSTKLGYVVLGFYQYPDVTPAGFNSWIADECEEGIYFLAAAIVFGTVLSNQSAAGANQAQASQALKQLVSTNILGEGY